MYRTAKGSLLPCQGVCNSVYSCELLQKSHSLILTWFASKGIQSFNPGHPVLHTSDFPTDGQAVCASGVQTQAMVKSRELC